MNKYFDIIIPAYNPGAFLEHSISSCLSQSHKKFKIIVVDDCSTQNLEPFKKKFPQIELIRTPKNLGPAGARNFGIKHSDSEYISFLDADDIMERDRLNFSLEGIEKSKEVGMICGNYQMVNKNRILAPFYKKPISVTWEKLLKQNLVACGSVSIKRSVLTEIGLFDERFWIAEDLDLWVRCAERYLINYLHRVLYFYNITPGRNSLTQRKDIQENHIKNLEIIKKESIERMMKINEDKARKLKFNRN